MATVEDLQSKIDEVVAAGDPITFDFAQLSFIDCSAIYCFVRAAAMFWHRRPVGGKSRSIASTIRDLSPLP